MPTIAQMAAMGDLNTGINLLESAKTDYTWNTNKRDNAWQDSILNAAYSTENAAKTSGLSGFNLDPNNHVNTYMPEIINGSLMAFKA